MRTVLSCSLALGASLLGAITARAQGDPVASEWCDSTTDICFQRHYDADLDFGFGYIFPPEPAAGAPRSTEFIGIFTGPRGTGWLGNSLGGGMRNNPLIVAWVNADNSAVATIRQTERFGSPPVLEGPTITVLGTSGVNTTHQRIVYRCQDCTTWTGGVNAIAFTGIAPFGFAAHGSERPRDDGSADAGIPQHSVAGQHGLNVTRAQSDTYNLALEQLQAAPPLPPPVQEEASPSSTASPPVNTSPSSCANAPAPSFSMKTGNGWVVTPVLGKLRTPRGITLDSRGNLLVIERGIGVTGHTVDASGCVTSSKVIIEDGRLNHGIDVHPSGNRLVASSPDVAWMWDYNPEQMTASNRRTLVTGMDNPGHVTRTVLFSRRNPDHLLISVGANGNIEQASFFQSTGTAQIRVFDVSRLPENDSVVYTDDEYGKIMGFGMRNDVGLVEDSAGIVHSIENSMDEAFRIVNGERRDIHNDNPAEKVYRLGSTSSPASVFGGYPVCFTVWEGGDFGNGDTPKIPGDWFVQDTTNGTFTDDWCEANAVKPTVILPPHTAPLDMKFGARDGDHNLYAALHGSWNRSPPQGYKVVAVPGQLSSSGEWSPSASLADTKTSARDVLANLNENECGKGCFRPVGLVFGNSGNHLYVSSDTSGEIFLLRPGSASSISPSTKFISALCLSLLALMAVA
ncbi:cellobiose dehydrogenase [Coprinopsis marcescibilis]|uniref:Cellobiose dehydrogenase n=1 Tax=Coprinopsis marcescibilis TaxID=230819 RepID=A0A5C3L6N1_COPMA|nr:cellobiose dehydrogenase [Coprinopsis marcescibilis]